MERPEIVELFYSALVGPEDPEQLFRFLSRKVEWILSAADPHTLGEESPSNALKFSGKEGFRQLALYLRDSLNVISGELTGCITHHHLVFSFARVRLRNPLTVQPVEINLATKFTFHGSKANHGFLDPWSFMSAVESKPATKGRIKTSHFFPLNRKKMFWQGVI